MLVDNAIVMLENIYRRHQNGEDPKGLGSKGASEVWGRFLNATLANLAVFIPVLFMRDEAGQLFRDIAMAISAAVALSMLVAVAVVPTAAMRILKRHDRRHEHDTSTTAHPRRRRPGWRGCSGRSGCHRSPGCSRFAMPCALWTVEWLLAVNRRLAEGVMPRLRVRGD